MKKSSFTTLFSLLLTFGLFTQLSANVTYLSELKATEHELGHVLEWTTSTESNNKHFVVEKSTDNVKFVELATIEAQANSNKNNNYYFVDMDLGSANDKYYYRLRQVDMDGTFSTSKVASITKVVSNNFSMETFNNTENLDEYIFSYKSKVAGEMKLDVVNLKDGSVAHTDIYTASVGVHDLNLDLTNIAAGDYELVFSMGDEKENIAIRKMSPTQQDNMMSRKANKKENRN